MNGEVVDSVVNFVVPLVEVIDHFIDGGLRVDCNEGPRDGHVELLRAEERELSLLLS